METLGRTIIQTAALFSIASPPIKVKTITKPMKIQQELDSNT